MNINEFVEYHDLKVGDVIIVKKVKWRVFDHAVVFLGFHYSQAVFAANMIGGIRVLNEDEIQPYLLEYEPEEVIHLDTSYTTREEAYKRAFFAIHYMNGCYNLIANNCQHFANWVQWGRLYSRQVNDLGGSTMVAGGFIALIGLLFGDRTLTGIGVVSFGAGAITKGFAEKQLSPEQQAEYNNFVTLSHSYEVNLTPEIRLQLTQL